MKNKKNTKIIISIIIAITIIISTVTLIINYSKDDTSLSIIEKKWITNNINNVVDVNVYNDIPVYGYNGSGIIFDFLDNFSKEYNINFNKISYYTTDEPKYSNIAFKVLNNEENLTDDDILIYKDNYVVLSQDVNIVNNLDDLKEINIGMLADEEETINNYFNDYTKIKSYNTIEELIISLKNKEINYIIVPNMMYMDKILSNKLNIVYHISDLNKKYILSIKDNTIYNIMKKYYNKYLETNYQDDYSKEYLNIYFSSTKTDQISQKNYNGLVYKYGYVINMPYENYSDSNFVGTISNYLSEFEKIANVEIEVIRYDNIDDLKNALVSKEVDFALTNFDYSNINMENVTTLPFADEDYVILSKKNININSIKGLKDYEIYLVGSSNLYTLCNKNGIKSKIFPNTDDLIRNIDDNSIILIDKSTYYYYKKEKLSNYKIIYEDTIENNYKFIINKEYQTIYQLFNYYINSSDYNNIKFKYNTDIALEKDYTNIKAVILVITIIIILIVISLMINRRKDITNNISKEDKLKYIDPMTSLKNRNYLNHSIYKWDDNVIFPQSVIMLDINKLKEINDRLGREAGDEIIKKVASILINNQLENTDIIRSGGDEFLIYMVGYDEKKVAEYAKKISKLTKEISHSEGIEIGYSMILDEVKTVDDAINESILMMTKNKSKNK